MEDPAAVSGQAKGGLYNKVQIYATIISQASSLNEKCAVIMAQLLREMQRVIRLCVKGGVFPFCVKCRE
jgi:hypothetical protein